MKSLFLAVTMVVATLSITAREAGAGEPSRTPTVELLGKTVCPSWAPRDARCDVRLGAHPNTVRALGMTICAGPVPTRVRCDVSLPATAHSAPLAKLSPRVVPIFGKHICFGDVPTATQCDLRVGGSAQTATLHRPHRDARM